MRQTAIPLLLMVTLFSRTAQSETQPVREAAPIDFCAAADTARKEIGNPSVDTQSTRSAFDLRRRFLEGLSLCGLFTGANPQMDAEARRAFEEGIARYAVGDPERIADLHHDLATYFIRTMHLGLAVPLLKKELALRERLENRLKTARAETDLALVYWGMGESEIAAVYRTRARENAARYFPAHPSSSTAESRSKGERSSGPNAPVGASDAQEPIRENAVSLTDWAEYADMIGRWMQMAASIANRQEVDVLYRLLDTVFEKLHVRSPAHYSGANFLADAGDIERARDLLAKGDAALQQDLAALPMAAPALRQQRPCTAGAVELRAQRYAAAVEMLQECLESGRTNPGAWNAQNFVRYPAYLGLAYEGAGNLRKAEETFRDTISTMERARLDYSVAERVAVFRTGEIREFYWGMIRVATRRAQQSGTAEDFLAALLASDSLRARQLGDLLAPDKALTAATIRKFRSRLQADEAVLIYTTMDRHLVLLAFTADQQVAHLLEHDGKAFRNEIVVLARDLARGNADMSSLEPRLGRVGRKLLAPAKPILARKKKLLLLPDGPLNAIPFDVLSLDEQRYRPLLADYAIRVAPSLTLLLHQEELTPAKTGLFAVGDPVYAKSPAMPASTLGAEQAATRSSRYLDSFSPLPETRTEVKAIASTFKGQPVELALGPKAKESYLKHANLRRYRYLHLATHGILGGEVPGLLEPAIVLGEESGEDGFLTAGEVERLKLKADLTVLSACSTGTGQFFEGEGVMSLSRAFTMADSRSMVVSLWPVPSKETESLMIAFYRKLRSGNPVAEALRQAKLELRNQPKEPSASREAVAASGGGLDSASSPSRGVPMALGNAPAGDPAGAVSRTHPFYWAGFILFGG